MEPPGLWQQCYPRGNGADSVKHPGPKVFRSPLSERAPIEKELFVIKCKNRYSICRTCQKKCAPAHRHFPVACLPCFRADRRKVKTLRTNKSIEQLHSYTAVHLSSSDAVCEIKTRLLHIKASKAVLSQEAYDGPAAVGSLPRALSPCSR
jgi:hypothetical protein